MLGKWDFRIVGPFFWSVEQKSLFKWEFQCNGFLETMQKKLYGNEIVINVNMKCYMALIQNLYGNEKQYKHLSK